MRKIIVVPIDDVPAPPPEGHEFCRTLGGNLHLREIETQQVVCGSIGHAESYQATVRDMMGDDNCPVCLEVTLEKLDTVQVRRFYEMLYGKGGNA